MENLRNTVTRGGLETSLKRWLNDQPYLFDDAISQVLRIVVKNIQFDIMNAVFDLQIRHKANGELSEAEKIAQMGTTLCACFEIGRRAYVVNVGDSRAYLIRQGVAKLITRDHSFKWELMVERGLSSDEALALIRENFEKKFKDELSLLEKDHGKDARQRHVTERSRKFLEAGLVRSVSGQMLANNEIDVFVKPLEPNDRIVLVTDGFLQALAMDYGERKMEEPIARLFNEPFWGDPGKMAISRAKEIYKKERGSLSGLDNLSVVIREPRS